MTFRRAALSLLVVISAALYCGCGGPKVDEKKPLAEIRTEAQKMTYREIRRVAEAYGEAILEKHEAIEDLRDELEDLKPEELANTGAAKLKKDADTVASSISALSERQDLYVDLLHTKVDEEKPLADIEAETQAMTADKIRSIAEGYCQAINKRRAETVALEKKLAEMKPEEKEGREARRFAKQIATAAQTDAALVQRFDLYVKRLTAKGGDATGLTPETPARTPGDGQP